MKLLDVLTAYEWALLIAVKCRYVHISILQYNLPISNHHTFYVLHGH